MDNNPTTRILGASSETMKKIKDLLDADEYLTDLYVDENTPRVIWVCVAEPYGVINWIKGKDNYNNSGFSNEQVKIENVSTLSIVVSTGSTCVSYSSGGNSGCESVPWC